MTNENMRAVTITAFGGPEAIQIARLPIEEPGAGQVRIKLTAAAVHPVDLSTLAEKVDGVLDAAVLGEPALAMVRDDGVFISVVGSLAPASQRGVRVDSVMVRSDGARLHELAKLAESGGLALRVAGIYPLEQAAAAHERFGQGGLRGRLVLTP